MSFSENIERFKNKSSTLLELFSEHDVLVEKMENKRVNWVKSYKNLNIHTSLYAITYKITMNKSNKTFQDY